MRYTVLLVDDDEGALERGATALKVNNYQPYLATTHAEAVRMSEKIVPDVALLHSHLHDIAALSVIQSLLTVSPATACVVALAQPSCRMVVEAMRLGAFDVIEKPFDSVTLLQVVEQACRSAGICRVEPHAATRWATLVVRMLLASSDPRTVAEWGATIGVSTGALRNWCKTAGIAPRASLQFARALRAILLHQTTGLPAEQVLDLVDRRTLMKFAKACGGERGRLPPTMVQFLARQRLVNDRIAIVQVARLLRRQAIEDRNRSKGSPAQPDLMARESR